MRLQTNRLIICEFSIDMAEDVHKNSLDDDTRRFLPDEVFETSEDAADTIEYLMGVYETGDGPLVYPVLTKSGINIGYVQLVPAEDGYEVGYHIAESYTCRGYATEALGCFLEHIMPAKNITKVSGICLSENIASCRVLEKCGFEKVYEGLGKYQGQKRQIVKYVYCIS